MFELKNYSLEDFIIKTQDKTSKPGGGAICALTGALSASLMIMVDALSKNQSLEDLGKVKNLCQNLQTLIQKDSEAFQGVLDAYKLPKETEEEKVHYQQAVEKGYHVAIKTPLEVCQNILDLLKIQKEMKDKVHKYAMSDLKVAASLSYGALEGAGFMVKTNLPGLGQEDQRGYEKTLDKMLKEGLAIKKDLMK